MFTTKVEAVATDGDKHTIEFQQSNSHKRYGSECPTWKAIDRSTIPTIITENMMPTQVESFFNGVDRALSPQLDLNVRASATESKASRYSFLYLLVVVGIVVIMVFALIGFDDYIDNNEGRVELRYLWLLVTFPFMLPVFFIWEAVMSPIREEEERIKSNVVAALASETEKCHGPGDGISFHLERRKVRTQWNSCDFRCGRNNWCWQWRRRICCGRNNWYWQYYIIVDDIEASNSLAVSIV